jgi:hypothetical protein
VIPIAVEANLTPGLVRVMRKLRPGHPSAARQRPDHFGIPLVAIPLMCLAQIAEKGNVGDKTAFWKPAVDAGMVRVITDLLHALDNASTIANILRLSEGVLLACPPGGVDDWAGGLPRAIAGLLTARPPVALGAAVHTLFDVGVLRPDLLAGFPTWGAHESVQQLTGDSHFRTAAAAKGLLFIVDHGLDVSFSPWYAFFFDFSDLHVNANYSWVLGPHSCKPVLAKSLARKILPWKNPTMSNMFDMQQR